MLIHKVSQARVGRWGRCLATLILASLTAHTVGCAAGRGAIAPSRPPDLVIVNAKVWTGADSGGQPEPTAILIRGERIVAVGSNLDIWARVGSSTHVIDANGRRVIPGITDSHAHIVVGGFQLARLNLRDVGSRNRFVEAVAREAREKKHGEWVLGGRWSVESWDQPESPTRHWLDPVTQETPVFLSRMDGHQAVVNSAALQLAGIDANGPPDPKGGEIERDPHTGEPTGILKESAKELVSRFIPTPSPEDRYLALLRAMKHANALGVTSMHVMSSEADLHAFRRAEKEGKATVRITAYLSTSDWTGQANRIPRFQLDSDMVRLAGLKGFMDGSMGSRTAYMREPYSDASPDMLYPRGHLTAFADPFESLAGKVAMADAKHLQLAVHAIGDEANHLLLNAYEHALNKNGRRNARHRIEHAQHLQVADIPRFARLGLVASMQPFHKADDGRYAEKAIGSARLAGSYAFRQLVDAGALVAFGSDWPVVTLNPFQGIDAAVNARTLAGRVWLASHSLTLEEALKAYTIWPAKAIHCDDRLGTIEPGKYADLLILADDPFAIRKRRIGEVKVDRTIVGGRIVYTRE